MPLWDQYGLTTTAERRDQKPRRLLWDQYGRDDERQLEPVRPQEPLGGGGGATGDWGRHPLLREPAPEPEPRQKLPDENVALFGLHVAAMHEVKTGEKPKPGSLEVERRILTASGKNLEAEYEQALQIQRQEQARFDAKQAQMQAGRVPMVNMAEEYENLPVGRRYIDLRSGVIKKKAAKKGKAGPWGDADEIEASPEQLARARKFVDQIAGRLPQTVGELEIAAQVAPEERGLVAEMVRRHFAKAKPMEGAGYTGRALTSAAQGVVDALLPMSDYLMTNKPVPELTPDQERFRQWLVATREAVDPTIRPDTPFYGRWLQQATRQAYPMALSISAGGALGGSAKALGAGQRVVSGAQRLGISGSFYPQIYTDAYREMIGEGMDDDTAKPAAAASAVVEAALETIIPNPFAGAGKGLTRGGIRRVSGATLKEWLRRTGGELTEQGFQGATREVAKRIAQEHASGDGEYADALVQSLGPAVNRGIDEMKEAAGPMLFMTAPGGVRLGVDVASQSINRRFALDALKERRAESQRMVQEFTKPDVAAAWAERNPERAAAMAAGETPSRRQWREDYGLPKSAGEAERSQFAAAVREFLAGRAEPEPEAAGAAMAGRAGVAGDRGPLAAFMDRRAARAARQADQAAQEPATAVPQAMEAPGWGTGVETPQRPSDALSGDQAQMVEIAIGRAESAISEASAAEKRTLESVWRPMFANARETLARGGVSTDIDRILQTWGKPEDAQQIQKAAQSDASRGPRMEAEREGRPADLGSEGVRGGGQEVGPVSKAEAGQEGLKKRGRLTLDERIARARDALIAYETTKGYGGLDPSSRKRSVQDKIRLRDMDQKWKKLKNKLQELEDEAASRERKARLEQTREQARADAKAGRVTADSLEWGTLDQFPQIVQERIRAGARAVLRHEKPEGPVKEALQAILGGRDQSTDADVRRVKARIVKLVLGQGQWKHVRKGDQPPPIDPVMQFLLTDEAQQIEQLNDALESVHGNSPNELASAVEEYLGRSDPFGHAGPKEIDAFLRDIGGLAPPPKTVFEEIGPSPEAVGLKRESRTEQREALGLPEETPIQPESVPAWIAEAQAKLAAWPTEADDLVKLGQSRKEHAYNHRDLAVLAVDLRAKHNAVNDARLRLEDAEQNNNTTEAALAEQEMIDLRNKIEQILSVVQESGTTGFGRAGVMLQQLIRADYTLEGMKTRLRKAKGAPLDPNDPVDARNLSTLGDMESKIRELEERLNEAQSSHEQKQADAALDKSIKSFTPKKGKGPKRAQARQAVQAAWKEFSDSWSAMKQVGAVFDPKAEAAKQVALLKSATKVVKAYIDLGVATFAEFMAGLKASYGQDAIEARQTLRAAWDAEEAAGNIPEVEPLDPADRDSVRKRALQLARAVVEAGGYGVKDREAVVDAVHDELRRMVPGISRGDTALAIARYGDYREPTQDDVELTLHDIQAQLREIIKLEDMERGEIPSRSGQGRPEPSDDLRKQRALVHEMKKASGLSGGGPAQVRMPLDTAKTVVRNQIADLENAIANKQRILKKTARVKRDAELSNLEFQRNELRKAYAEMFPREGRTVDQKVAATIRGLDAAIAALQMDLEATPPKIGRKPKAERITDPEVEARRAKLDSLKAQREALRKADPQFQADEEARSNAIYKANLLARKAKYTEKIAKRDFGRPEETHKDLPDDIFQAKYELDQEKAKFKRMETYYNNQRQPRLKKALRWIGEVLNISRAIITSFDLSGLGRQGGLVAYARPGIFVKSIWPMVKATFSEKASARIQEQIRRRPNFQFGERVGLALTSPEGKLSQMEEAYMSNWLHSLPKPLKVVAWPVLASERAYSTVLNEMRANLFDTLCATLTPQGRPTVAQGKAIAAYVNAITGRANLWGSEKAATDLATVFFSPRFVVSRFQLALGTPLWAHGADAQVRKLLAKELGWSILGAAIFYGSAYVLGKGLLGGDDEEFTIGANPLDADIGKLRIGKRRIDPMAGMSQTTRFMTRVLNSVAPVVVGGEENTDAINRRFGTERFGETMSGRDLLRYGQQKFSPWLSSSISFVTEEDVFGRPQTRTDTAITLVSPLVFRDIKESLMAEGMSAEKALGLMAIAGIGVQTYDSKKTKGTRGKGRGTRPRF